MLNENILKGLIANKCEVFTFAELDSTNTEAKRMIRSGFNKEAIVVADSQTAGRGRLGRSFYSPCGTGIYMSMILHPNASAVSMVSLTSVCAVGVCRAIESVCGTKTEIKWVNDIYLHGKKVCGILTESITDGASASISSIIIGIGVNVTTSDFPEEISQTATSIGRPIDPYKLISAICNEIYSLYLSIGSAEIMDEYRSRSLILGKSINFYENGIKRGGTVTAIDNSGALIVDCDGESVSISSGEVTVRLKEDDHG